MAEIIWTEPALTDLEAIADYIALDKPDVASALLKRVFGHVEHLHQYPESGSRAPELKRSRHRQLVEPRVGCSTVTTVSRSIFFTQCGRSGCCGRR
jgi:plasmid stabilization system protein ParE